MAIEGEELRALCENLGLPFEDQGDGTAVTVLPFEDEEERTAYGPLLIEWMAEGRGLRLTSDTLFNAADIVTQQEEMAKLMAQLIAQGSMDRFGSVGMTQKLNVYYSYTVVLEDNTLSLAQFKSILALMLEGVRGVVRIVQAFEQEMPVENTGASTPEELEAYLQEAAIALRVIENRLGTQEQQEGARDFLAGLLESKHLPAELLESLRKQVAPIFKLESVGRPLW